MNQMNNRRISNKSLGEFRLTLSRTLTADEKACVIKLPSSHRITEEEIRICKEIKNNWHNPEMKVSNILIEGDAGSGKTEVAKAMSAHLGIPYTKITCFADMDKSDVLGSILPVIDDKETGEQPAYRFYPSEIIRAFRNGYLLEIQEPTVIRDAAVLMVLNSALELDGSINLPTEVVHRHPDFIVVITTNRNYTGCRPLNEALRDRIQHAEKMDLPAKEVMIERTIGKTNYSNIKVLNILADIIVLLDKTAKANGIKGVAGMRSLLYWANSIGNGEDIYHSLYQKVIYKITTDEEEIKILEEGLATKDLIKSLEDVTQEIQKEAEDKKKQNSESIEIRTWGNIENFNIDRDRELDDKAIALRRSANSEESTAELLETSGGMESSDSGEYGSPQYHQANPEDKKGIKKQKENEKQKEQEFRKELNHFARELAKKSVHKGVKLLVHRPEYNPEYELEYKKVRNELMPVVREIARKTLPLLEHEVTNDFTRNHYYGSKFQADHVVYQDFRNFSKKRPPSEEPSLVVGLRIDESASMSAFGRLEAAKRAVIAVYEFCEICDIPVLIYGDTADVSKLEQMSVFAYADYEKKDPSDPYRFMGIRGRSNNRDGMALKIIAERLITSNRRTKLLISISDGQPKAMKDYTGKTAILDMQSTIAEYERKGITFLAAAIGQDKDIISDIYGNERFLDITDLKEFPTKLVQIIARYL